MRSIRKGPVFAVMLAVGLVNCDGSQVNEETQVVARPNVIVVLADDMRVGYTGHEGHPVIETPNIDALAAAGTVFSNAFATSAACTPSRTSLLSGLWERRHGINFNSNSAMTSDAWARTYPMLLKDAGYFIGYIGKNHTPIGKNEDDAIGYSSGIMDNSFDYWYAGHKHLSFYPKDKTRHKIFANAKADTQVEIMEEGMDNFFTPDKAFQEGYNFLDSRPRDKPFALLLNFNVPHGSSTGSMALRESDLALYRTSYRDQVDQIELTPTYIAEEDIVTPKIPKSVYNGKYIKSYNYVKTPDDMVEREIRTIQTVSGIDKLLGKLLVKLDEQGIADNTIIVFTSDHGLMHGEHGLGGKVLLYEPSIRVPFIVYDPRSATPVLPESDELVALVDIAPTLLDLTGVPIPQETQGMSLKPLMQGTGTEWRETLFLENNMTIQNYPRVEGVRTAQWKYIRYFDKALDQEYADMLVASINGEQPVYEELYDLANDPVESHNVIADPANGEILDQLRTENAALVKELRGTGPLDTHIKVNDIKVDDIKRYDGSWESLQSMPVPAWFDDGKIGIFVTWGPYSDIGYRRGDRGYAEHVPKLIYNDPEHYYPYIKERWGAAPPDFGYKDVVPEFTAENWNPDEWAELFAAVGAAYVVMTAEHHDGFAMWDSDLTPWNAVDKGPRRDLVGDLGKALRKKGLKYAPSYHRERHPGYFAVDKFKVYSEPRPDIAEEIRRVPEAVSLYGPFKYSDEFIADYVARWKEIQDKYQPDFLWIDDVPIFRFDTPHVQSDKFRDALRGMITDFMNAGAGWGKEVYVNNKGKYLNWPEGVGVREKDNLKLDVIGPKWESCTTFGSSFGYLEVEEKNDSYKKTPKMVVHEMIEVVSRNGNFLINIGPMADGTIPPGQVRRLKAMGKWLEINGDAIYKTRYWSESDQKEDHLSFTTRGKLLYAIKLEEPSQPFTINNTKDWQDGSVQGVRLVGSNAAVEWTLTEEGLHIVPPADLGKSMFAWAYEILTDEEQHTPTGVWSTNSLFRPEKKPKRNKGTKK